jgi:hypothetical protein
MKVRTTEDYDNTPQGSVIQDVESLGEDWMGMWYSPWGSYQVQIPKAYCYVLEPVVILPSPVKEAQTLSSHKQQLNERLAQLGYAPGELQYKWRTQKDLKFDMTEVDLAILDALVNMGGATAWSGDGSSCAAQIVQHVMELGNK